MHAVLATSLDDPYLLPLSCFRVLILYLSSSTQLGKVTRAACFCRNQFKPILRRLPCAQWITYQFRTLQSHKETPKPLPSKSVRLPARRAPNHDAESRQLQRSHILIDLQNDDTHQVDITGSYAEHMPKAIEALAQTIVELSRKLFLGKPQK